MTKDRVDGVFAALGDATRREVIVRLAAEPMTATELADVLPVSRQAVAKHLTTLAEAGLVAAERAGREVRYRLTPGPMTDAMAWLAGAGAEWDERLKRLRKHLAR